MVYEGMKPMLRYGGLLFAVLIVLFAASHLAMANYHLTILHTNDLHSNLEAFPRLSAQVEEIRKVKATNNEPLLLVDAGDFTIGTLYHLLTTTHSPELKFMSALGYDATTLGNHEFDWGPGNLAKIIEVASESKQENMVAIVASNIQFDFFDTGDDTLKTLYDAGIIQPYLIKTLTNGLQVGIIGLLGKQASQEAIGAAPVKFVHNPEFIQHVVDRVKNEGADIIVCLSHAGLEDDKKLARLIAGIDIIIGGHCHSTLFEPVQVGSTFITQAGAYGNYLGSLELLVGKKENQVRSYQLLPLGSVVSENEAMREIVENYRAVIDEKILAPIGLSFDEVLAETNFGLVKESDYMSGSNLGDLVTDALRFALNFAQPEEFVNFSFYPTGFLRGNLSKGEIKTSDVLRVLSFGTGPEDIGGSPLISFYLNGQEVKNILELSMFLAFMRGQDYLFQVSGMRFWYNPLRPNFRKVTRIKRWEPDSNEYVTLDISDTEALYKVGVNLFLLNVYSAIEKYLPMFSIAPKDKNGNPVVTFGSEQDSSVTASKSLKVEFSPDMKEWQALINYVAHFSDVDGNLVPDVPLRYATKQKRINLDVDEILGYYNTKKDPVLSVGTALVFPSLGHVYTNNWFPNGFIFLLLELASALLASGESTREAGIFLFTSFKLLECKDAYDSALEYNRRLEKAFEVIPASRESKVSVGFVHRF